MQVHRFLHAELHGVAGGFLDLLGADRPPVGLLELAVEPGDEEGPAWRLLHKYSLYHATLYTLCTVSHLLSGWLHSASALSERL